MEEGGGREEGGGYVLTEDEASVDARAGGASFV